MEDFKNTTLGEALGKAPEPEAVKAEPVKAEPEKVEPTGAEVEAKTEPEKVESPPEPEKAEAEKKADSSPESEPSMIPASVMHGERERRQAADRRIAELEKELAKSADKPKERPSVFEDEEGAFKASQDAISTNVTNELLNAGEQEAITQHGQDTVNAAVEWLQKAVAESPSLEAKIRSTPAMLLHRKAVEMHKQEQARAELSDPDKLREKIRQEEREALLKEMKEEQEAKEAADKAKRNSIQTSLVGEDSKGGLKGTDWSGPTPLGAALKR